MVPQMIDRAEIERIVTTCWNIACNCDLPGTLPGVFLGIDASTGQQQMNTVRWSTYMTLLNNLLPKHTSGAFSSSMTVGEPKESWQE